LIIMAGEGIMYEDETFWHEGVSTPAERRVHMLSWAGMLVLAGGVWALAIYGAWRLIGG
jgi:hypothetical protein